MFRNMSNYESSLLDDFRRMEQQLDRMFGDGYLPNGIRSVARGAYPPINIGITENRVVVYLFAAGIDPQSLDISIQKNLLTIDGARPSTAGKEPTDYYRNERFSGNFHRVLTLPDDVDPDKVEASYSDGVLRVTIHRLEATKPKQIEVN